MVSGEESQTYHQLAAWDSQYMGNATFLQPEQNYSSPLFPSSTFTANIAFPWQSASDLQSLNPGKDVELPPPYCGISCPTGENALDARLGVAHKPNGVSFAPQKRFIIFDHSGNHTRLFISPSLSSHQNQTITSKIPTSSYRNLAAQVDYLSLAKPGTEEIWDENHLSDEEGDFLDDTEEIDALFYSDSDYTSNDDEAVDTNSASVEITSNKGHAPYYNTLKDADKDKDKLFEELDEEVASSNGSQKRQKLLDGSCKKSSKMSAESALKEENSPGYEDDVESCYAGAEISYDGISSSKSKRRVKIREALEILETIIPGPKNQDPLSTIDKAIIYLKSLKTEAQALKLHDHSGVIEDKRENTNVE